MDPVTALPHFKRVSDLVGLVCVFMDTVDEQTTEEMTEEQLQPIMAGLCGAFLETVILDLYPEGWQQIHADHAFAVGMVSSMEALIRRKRAARN